MQKQTHNIRPDKAMVTIEPILIDIDTVAALTGLSVSTIQKLGRRNDFPKARAASDKSPRWLVSEVKEWANTRPIADFLPPPNTAEGGRNSKPNSKASVN